MEAELQERLRGIPGVDAVTALLPDTMPVSAVVTTLVRDELARLRGRILEGDQAGSVEPASVARRVADRWTALRSPGPHRVINATGVLIHTNLGRAPLAASAVEQVAAIAAGYSDLEFSLAEGRRGSRQDHVVECLRLLTGAEDAIVVNNNAAAVWLTLAATAADREVVISRGELVEIGGSFRIPDVLSQSGASLHEVGTTNRTHKSDYERALNERTGLLLQVHTSNYRLEGFTAAVSLEELVALGAEHGVPVAVDLGSGAFLDMARTGMRPEPLVRDVVASGADLVTFSGDKLLGGPQAGVVVGSAERIRALREHPLARAVRIDKLLLTALSATLALHLDPDRARREIPVHRMLFETESEVAERAEALLRSLGEAFAGSPGPHPTTESDVSPVGGGSLPGEGVPTRLVVLDPGTRCSAAAWERELRRGDPAVLARIREDKILLDPRTVDLEEQSNLSRLVREAWDRAVALSSDKA